MIGRYLAAVLMICSLVFIPSRTVFGNVSVDLSEREPAQQAVITKPPYAYEGYSWLCPEHLTRIKTYLQGYSFRNTLTLAVSFVVIFFASVLIGRSGQQSASVNTPVIQAVRFLPMQSTFSPAPTANQSTYPQQGLFSVYAPSQPPTGSQSSPAPPPYKPRPSSRKKSMTTQPLLTKKASSPSLPDFDSFQSPSFLKLLNNALATELDFSVPQDALGGLEAIIEKVRHPDRALNAANAQGYVKILEALKSGLTKVDTDATLLALKKCEAYYVDGFLNIPNALLHYLELKAWTESYLKPKRVDEIGWSFENQNPFYLVADRLIRDVAGQLLSDADAEAKINTLIEQFNNRFNQELMSENASGNPDSHVAVETVE